MIEKIEELEKKNFRPSIFPQRVGKEWIWTAGVYVGDDPKAQWVDSNNGLPRAGYKTYKEAFEAIVNYCETYKPKRGR